MSISILRPTQSPAMESGNVVRWLKKEGDAVAEVGTDKATMEIEAFGEGVLSRIGSHEVPVILGTGAVEERLASRNGQPISVRAFTVTMSCDHRAVDGKLAARLLAEFEGIVEAPMRILA